MTRTEAIDRVLTYLRMLLGRPGIDPEMVAKANESIILLEQEKVDIATREAELAAITDSLQSILGSRSS
jgi:hypothetical protein